MHAAVKVFIAGATGVLGRRLVRQFAQRGHAVVGMARDEAGEKVVLENGGDPRRADLFDVDSLANAAEGVDIIIRAATSIPAKLRTSPKDWAMNDRIRREGTEALTEAAARVRAKAYLQEGIVWAVRGPTGSSFDEDAPPVPDPILASSLDAERIARDAGARHGFDVGTLRFGTFYSADAWHTQTMRAALLRHRPAMIGPGTNVWSFVHSDDAASAFVSAAEHPRTGVWHVVDDRPVALVQFLGSMAKRLAAPPPRGFPKALARLALGKYVTELMTASFATTNARFRGEFGWAPKFPTVDEGLDEVVTSWQAGG